MARGNKVKTCLDAFIVKSGRGLNFEEVKNFVDFISSEECVGVCGPNKLAEIGAKMLNRKENTVRALIQELRTAAKAGLSLEEYWESGRKFRYGYNQYATAADINLPEDDSEKIEGALKELEDAVDAAAEKGANHAE